MDENVKPDSAFAPLRRRVFAVLWVATVVGNIGGFVRDVASSWLVTDLSATPSAVAMIQVAATLPIFLLAIPAGVLSDILDRRRLLVAIQIVLASVSLGLLSFSALGLQSVGSLVAFTFLGGVGAALMGPTWQAVVPELVDRSDVKSAIALNSLGINIARSLGPALGGALLAYFGAVVAYGVDVITYVFVIAALLWWRRPEKEENALPERFSGAFTAGLRYAKASRELHVVLVRAAVFFAFSSAVWALLPLVARNVLAGTAGFYGVLLGAVGAGAIGGALMLPRLRARLTADGLMLCAAVVAATVMACLSIGLSQALAIVLMMFLGCAWITALTTLNGVAQSVLPNWVRGRSLAIYLTVFNGAMTFGSLAWGVSAEAFGVETVLMIAAVGLIISALGFHRMRLPKGDADLSPSNHWPEPVIASNVEDDRGPVLVTVEYRIDVESRRPFLALLHRFSGERRRDGAYAWGVTEDASDPTQIMEWFMVGSWAEHLRQHQRVSRADAELQTELRGYHLGETPPLVRHRLAIRNGDLSG